jgi:hypothetical protein
MTPHQVLALLTQNQTADLLTACCSYLSAERVAACLREGLEHEEILQLQQLLLDFSDETE